MARETSEIFAAPRSLPENFDVSLGENVFSVTVDGYSDIAQRH